MQRMFRRIESVGYSNSIRRVIGMSKARELAELGAVYDSGALSNRNLDN